jgi:pantetheine-phosphate adenylyltransferase
MKKIAVYSGSFDPLTNGHLWMIQTASKLVDVLNIAVGTNPGKKYMFTMDERINMIEQLPLRKNNVYTATISVRPFENKYLMDFVDEVSADYIIRGIRNETDYEFERAMMDINNDLFGEGIETIFLMPPRELQSVSSSMIKGLIGYKGWESAIATFVPPNVKDAIIKKVKEK